MWMRHAVREGRGSGRGSGGGLSLSPDLLRESTRSQAYRLRIQRESARAGNEVWHSLALSPTVNKKEIERARARARARESARESAREGERERESESERERERARESERERESE